MEVLALFEGPNEVSYRYRIQAFTWALAERGLLVSGVSIASNLFKRLAQLRSARRADVVVLQRKLLPTWQLMFLRRQARRLVFDVDDAVYHRDSNSPKGFHSATRTARYWSTVLAADAIVAGNEYVRDFTAGYAEPERIHVIPTCVEPNWYSIARHERACDSQGGEIRLAWIGQAGPLALFARARDHLAAVAARLPGVQLRLICDRSADLPLRVVPRSWSAAAETAELAQSDIGVCWLPDDSWSRGKCGLRVLQYMAAGLPVVANPVGASRSMIVHGQTGLLASTPQQWAEAVAHLAASPQRRGEMGSAGRRLVEERYSMRAHESHLASVISGVSAAPVSAPPRPLMASDIAAAPDVSSRNAART